MRSFLKISILAAVMILSLQVKAQTVTDVIEPITYNGISKLFIEEKGEIFNSLSLATRYTLLNNYGKESKKDVVNDLETSETHLLKLNDDYMLIDDNRKLWTVPYAATMITNTPKIDPELIDVYRMNGGFGFQVALHVYLPLISGYLKQAFVNAAGMGLKVVVSAEYLVQTKDSLGKAVYSSAYFSEYAEIYAYALIMVFMVLLITEVPGLLIRKKTA